jgi:hypothetical protein
VKAVHTVMSLSLRPNLKFPSYLCLGFASILMPEISLLKFCVFAKRVALPVKSSI